MVSLGVPVSICVLGVAIGLTAANYVKSMAIHETFKSRSSGSFVTAGWGDGLLPI